jgi:hypothetical protein
MTSFTLIHVGISIVAILSGFVVLTGMLKARQLEGWTTLFLATAALTSVTGFFFPFHGITPAIVVGIISLVVLSVAMFARYPRKLAGAWRKAFVISALLGLYFDIFVLIVQAFQKIPALKLLAPAQGELLFKVTQLIVLAAFVVLGVFASIRFRCEPVFTPAPDEQVTSTK